MGTTMGCVGWKEDGGTNTDVFGGAVEGMVEDKLST